MVSNLHMQKLQIPLVFSFVPVQTHHSRSPSPITPTLIPFDDVNISVLSQFASATFSPSAGSRTFANSHGNLH